MKKRPVATSKSEVVAALPAACSDERAAVEFWERHRWGDTPNCPRCGDTAVVQMKAKDGSRNARFLWRCHGCKQQFSVRVGTVMEDSPIPVRHWCHALWLACSSKKGVSAKQIERTVGVSYKSALFLMHRIRFAMVAPDGGAPLGVNGGTVEVDETYVGGKPRKKGTRRPGRPSPKAKAPVVGMVERDGRMRLLHVDDLSAPNLRGAIKEHIAESSRLITDEYNLYTRIGRDFEGGHETVKHSDGEYARGDVTTNTIESVFALLKRSIYGTYHNVSRKHLHRYLSEREFVYNFRRVDDGERMVRAIQQADNRRLTYKQQIGRE